jgi:hypothetical protein
MRRAHRGWALNHKNDATYSDVAMSVDPTMDAKELAKHKLAIEEVPVPRSGESQRGRRGRFLFEDE